MTVIGETVRNHARDLLSVFHDSFLMIHWISVTVIKELTLETLSTHKSISRRSVLVTFEEPSPKLISTRALSLQSHTVRFHFLGKSSFSN